MATIIHRSFEAHQQNTIKSNGIDKFSMKTENSSAKQFNVLFITVARGYLFVMKKRDINERFSVKKCMSLCYVLIYCLPQ